MKQKQFRFSIVAFIAAFVVGMLYVYVTAPPVKYVVTYPTPYNVGDVVYKDAANTCFVFDADRTECPSDKSKIKKQPIIE